MVQEFIYPIIKQVRPSKYIYFVEVVCRKIILNVLSGWWLTNIARPDFYVWRVAFTLTLDD